MKKIVGVILSICIIVGACTGNKTASDKGNDNPTNPSNNKGASSDLMNNPVYTKGLELYAKNDCSTCHAINEKINGPSYVEVAKKYNHDEKMVPELAKRIIKGGSGVWGDALMTAHTGLSQEDAEALVRYIYLLKE
jgi:cytochrome c